METKKILGIDPGTRITGYAVLECSKKGISLCDIGVVDVSKEKEINIRLKNIFLSLQDTFKKFSPNIIAIEDPFYGKNVQSMLKLGRIQGLIMAIAIRNGVICEQYSPREIKQSVTGKGAASKEQIAGMLERIISFSVGNLSLDASDALAVAYCSFSRGENNFYSTSKGKSNKKNNWSSFLKENPDRLHNGM